MVGVGSERLDSDSGSNASSKNERETNIAVRRRSMSVATGQPSVETVVVKAKRAASTLWTLLHAQSCVLADKCTHPGCQEAKLLHLHVKTCPAGADFPCPSRHHGCDQARKLMAHYRRCRGIRAKQAGQHGGRRDPNQQHVCLVCSLVARQARTALERTSSNRASHSSVSSSRKTSTRKVISSFMLNASNEIVAPSVQQKMPPPPPRWKSTTPSSGTTESPSSSDHLLRQTVPVSVATAVARAPFDASLVSLESLGKSIDTAKGSLKPPKEVPQGRVRSASCVDSTEDSTKRHIRARSASCGDPLSDTISTTASGESGTCETILEEEEYHQSKESIDPEFNLDLARRQDF